MGVRSCGRGPEEGEGGRAEERGGLRDKDGERKTGREMKGEKEWQRGEVKRDREA